MTNPQPLCYNKDKIKEREVIKMAYCAECGVKLVYDDTSPLRIEDGEVKDVNLGHCPKCGKTYRWKEIYAVDRVEDMEPYEY